MGGEGGGGGSGRTSWVARQLLAPSRPDRRKTPAARPPGSSMHNARRTAHEGRVRKQKPIQNARPGPDEQGQKCKGEGAKGLQGKAGQGESLRQGHGDNSTNSKPPATEAGGQNGVGPPAPAPHRRTGWEGSLRAYHPTLEMAPAGQQPALGETERGTQRPRWSEFTRDTSSIRIKARPRRC